MASYSSFHFLIVALLATLLSIRVKKRHMSMYTVPKRMGSFIE
jgi:hypothetical protein